MEISEVRDRLEEAVKSFFDNQPNIFEYTSQTHQTEWNIACHLAKEIHQLFPEYDYDLDIVKPNLDNRRPDNVLHKRKTHDYNFLVVEVEKDGQPAKIKADEEKTSHVSSAVNCITNMVQL